MLIGLGTHYPPIAEFEGHMRAVIEFSLDQGVVPILATKVDVEGGDRVNAIIAYLAQQYEVPLWNFWLAEQPLYNKGQPEGDGIHFTRASNYFDSEMGCGEFVLTLALHRLATSAMVSLWEGVTRWTWVGLSKRSWIALRDAASNCHRR